MNTILLFTSVAFFLVISPGPNWALIAKTTAEKGVLASFFNIIGLVLATFFHGAFSIFGLSAIVLHTAELFLLVKFIGGCYLLYIGSKAILSSLKRKSSVELESVKVPKSDKCSLKKSFNEGFITQILNPKVSLFYLAVFPQFLSFESPLYLEAFSLVAIHAAIIACWFVIMAVILVKITDFMQTPAINRWIQGVSGAIMVGFAALIFAGSKSK